jgi:F-type H+-transporting ATPase subunit epsilon
MAEQKQLQLTISRVDGPVYEGSVTAVTVPGIAGEMTILANHSALISPLKKGTIVIQKEGGDAERIEIESGTLEISQNHATVLI